MGYYNDKTCDDCAYFEYKPGFFIDYSSCLKHKRSTKRENTACKDFVPKKNGHSYKRSGFWITTFICNVLGISLDDNVYLAMKDLREDFLEQDNKYKEILNEYDAIGPLICIKMRMEENVVGFANYLYNNFIKLSALAWNEGNADEAYQIYLNMFELLKEKYGFTNRLSEKNSMQLKRTREDLKK